MKYLITYIFLICSYLPSVAQSLKIGVISDIHYLSEKLMDGGKAQQDYVNATGRNIAAVPSVIDKVLEEYYNSDISILLICGDMTKDGERQSHLDLVGKLKPLQDKGVKIFVVPGNHDINMPNPVGFRGDKTFPVSNISPSDFTTIYAGCGYNQAIKKDTASLSYVAELDKATWLLAIDAARYKEYKKTSISGGKASKETEMWMNQVLQEAKQKGIKVVGMMHWGVTEHIPYQAVFFGDYLVPDYQRLAYLFAGNGMNVIFTGHFHSNDISLFASPEGNTLYDVATGTLSAYPFSYRFVELSQSGMKVRTRNIDSLPQYPNIAERSKVQMQAIAKRIALQRLKDMNHGLPPSLETMITEMLSKIFVLHLYGDEKPDDELMAYLKQLSGFLGDDPMDMDNVELDFYPADNNIDLTF
ncbi:metallophosphoesterase [Dysgonomonas sp. 511]|uniref:metallophosphoesterase family protein n=1 Tax=Dysgonomonas sp. 511 TaxID=2302930 RepID=UPI0013D6963F|nr:metallophosphoesterase [Dysgonomonas sp. 511]NDV77648.1 metallophosphoesterase [Dysgonomonas sp. 511]